MINKKRNAIINLGWWLGLACVGGLGLGAWGLSKSDCTVKGMAERSFTIDVDFNTFRQILVRTDATAAIVEHGGMKVIDESTDSVDIDLSNDSRPLRNLLKGKSKANVTATKHLTVQLNDPQLKASELKLSQDCKIQPDNIRIVTISDQPAGELKTYKTSLDAVKANRRTEIRLSLDMTVDVCISRLFLPQAEVRVKQAAEKTMEEQESAIRSLVSKFEGDAIIMPVFKR